jgi:hypothetical protein
LSFDGRQPMTCAFRPTQVSRIFDTCRTHSAANTRREEVAVGRNFLASFQLAALLPIKY